MYMDSHLKLATHLLLVLPELLNLLLLSVYPDQVRTRLRLESLQLALGRVQLLPQVGRLRLPRLYLRFIVELSQIDSSPNT